MGLSTLFLVFGFLEWYEADEAPLDTIVTVSDRMLRVFVTVSDRMLRVCALKHGPVWQIVRPSPSSPR